MVNCSQAMEQHPVPQNIAEFKFKLFGSLTAKQFFTLIVPLSLAALIFFSGLPVIIRLPLSLVIGIFAFFIALVPINGQSFDKWAVAFIKAVLSPTQRIWIKDKQIPDFLSVIIKPPIVEEKMPEEVKAQKKEKLIAYLKTLPKDSASPLDVKEQAALSEIDYTAEIPVQAVSPPPVESTQQPPIIWPAHDVSATISKSYKISVQELKSKVGTKKISVSLPTHPAIHVTEPIKRADIKMPTIAIPELSRPKPPQAETAYSQAAKPRIALHARPYVLHGLEKRLEKHAPLKKEYVQLISTPTVNLASETNYSIDNIIPIRTPDNKIKLIHGIGRTRARRLHFAPPANFDISKLPIRGEKRFEVSENLKNRLTFEDTAPPVILPKQQETSKSPPPVKIPVKKIESMPKQERTVPHSGPTQKLSAAPPQSQARIKTQPASKFSVTDLKKTADTKKPLSSADIIPLTKTPNVISGLVTDSTGSSIAGAVLVVRDANGIPVRALKTNKLGQFLSATPLASGQYTIETESDLAHFKPITLDLKDKVVTPMAIVAEGGGEVSRIAN